MDTYKKILQNIVHGNKLGKSTDKVLEECQISQKRYYKVSNPNNTRPDGEPYDIPLTWVAPITIFTKETKLIEQICEDCGGIFIPDDKIKILRDKGNDFKKSFEELLKAIK